MEQMAKELLAAQEEVQRRFARAMRTRKQSVLKHAHESLLSDRRSSAAALRAEMDRHSGRDVTRRLSGVEPAPEKEVVALSKRFNKSLAHLFPESRSHMWFKLFQKMDPDESGQISFVEFQRGIREVLKEERDGPKREDDGGEADLARGEAHDEPRERHRRNRRAAVHERRVQPIDLLLLWKGVPVEHTRSAPG